MSQSQQNQIESSNKQNTHSNRVGSCILGVFIIFISFIFIMAMAVGFAGAPDKAGVYPYIGIIGMIIGLCFIVDSFFKK